MPSTTLFPSPWTASQPPTSGLGPCFAATRSLQRESGLDPLPVQVDGDRRHEGDVDRRDRGQVPDPEGHPKGRGVLPDRGVERAGQAEEDPEDRMVGEREKTDETTRPTIEAKRAIDSERAASAPSRPASS